MQDEQQGPSPETTSSYVETHCMTCAAGWTRRDEEGRSIVVCLLNREPVWPDMVHCNRYQPDEALSPHPDAT